MSSSDIYGTSGRGASEREAHQPVSKRRRRSSPESFDEAVNKDVSGTHHRRSRNSGVRRFSHLLRQPDFNRKFWVTTLSIFALILALLLLWDQFFRYSKPEPDVSPDTYQAVSN